MCMADYSDDDYTHLTTKTRRARKAWRCCDCSQAIEVGEHYVEHRGVYDGRIQVMRNCRLCEAASRWLTIVCNGYLFGAIGEDIAEHWDERYIRWYRPLGLGRLVLASKNRWRHRDGTRMTPEHVTALVYGALPTPHQGHVVVKALARTWGYQPDFHVHGRWEWGWQDEKEAA